MFPPNHSAPLFSFSLPLGFEDDRGTWHQEGVMRLATGHDQLYLLQDPRSLDNPAYGTLLMLSRVILQLGDLSPLTPEDLEGLFLLDWQYLQDFYDLINPSEAALSATGEF